MSRPAVWALAALLLLVLPAPAAGQGSVTLLINVHHATPQGCGEWGGGALYLYQLYVDDVRVATSAAQHPADGQVSFYDLVRVDLGARQTARIDFEILDRAGGLFGSTDTTCNLTSTDAKRFSVTYTVGAPQLVRSAGAHEAASVEAYISDTTRANPNVPAPRLSGPTRTDGATFTYDAISVPGLSSAYLFIPDTRPDQRGSTTSPAAGSFSATGLRENKDHVATLRAEGGSWRIESPGVAFRTQNVAPAMPTTSVAGPTNTTVKVSWSHTDEGHDLDLIEFFVSPPPVQPSTGSLAHTIDLQQPFGGSFFTSPVELTGLRANTSYEVLVRVTDNMGATNLSRVMAFRTTGGIAPPSAPPPPATTSPTPPTPTPTTSPTPTTTTAQASTTLTQAPFTFEELRAAFEVRVTAEVNVSREALRVTPGGERTVQVVLLNHGRVPLTVRTEAATALRIDAKSGGVAANADFTLRLGTTNVSIPPLSRVETNATIHAPPDAAIGDEVVFHQPLHVSDGRIGGNAFGFDVRVRVVAFEQPAVAAGAAAQTSPGDGLSLSSALIVGGSIIGVASLGGIVAFRREWVRFAVAAALYSRLAPGAALDHPMRESLLQRIRDRPGIRYSELRRESGLHTGALVHHLRTLERVNIIVSRKEGSFKRFWVVGAAPGAAAGTAHSSPVQVAPLTTMQQRVIDALREGPLTQAQLSERLDLTQQGTSYHLKTLERAGHVQAEYDGRSWVYSTVQETRIVRP